MQSSKRKLIHSLFILHPWGFIIFLVLGAVTFLYTAGNIQIPVYTTVETMLEEENGMMWVDLQNRKFQTGTPVFLYESRDDHLEKVTAYEVKEGWLLTASIDTLPDSGRLYVDLQTSEISLLQYIVS